MKYVVKWHDVIIGEYEQIDENNVKYTVDKKGIEKVEKEGYSVYIDLKEDYIGKTFPLLDNRIKNCSRFINDIIGYHTDPITLDLAEKRTYVRALIKDLKTLKLAIEKSQDCFDSEFSEIEADITSIYLWKEAEKEEVAKIIDSFGLLEMVRDNIMSEV